MTSPPSEGRAASRRRPSRRLLKALVGALLLMALPIAGLAAVARYQEVQSLQRHEDLANFYTVPSPPPPGGPGRLLRAQPVDFAPRQAQGWRVLYESQGPNGEKTVSSGLVFAPRGAAPAGGRPVVVWAHGTTGLGDDCAPSRSANPLAQMDWLGGMLDRGWVVTAPDYAGLGTSGVMRYLVGAAEGRDLLNAVRAARGLNHAGAGGRFALWGHSQGGHAVLFAAQMASAYAPELQLMAAGTAAPAAELVPLIHQQYAKAVAWAIGPEVAVAWPDTYPGLRIEQVMSGLARQDYKPIAKQCVLVAGIEGALRNDLGQRFFSRDPTSVSNWRAVLGLNTVPLPPARLPLFIAQGLSDEVVLPDTSALLVQHYCQADVVLTTDWISGIGHVKVADAVGPKVTSWLADRFGDIPAGSNCDQPLPVTPATIPTG
jgi:acetyl esterase/lipase